MYLWECVDRKQPWSLAYICWCGPELHLLNVQPEPEHAPLLCCQSSCKRFPLVHTGNWNNKKMYQYTDNVLCVIKVPPFLPHSLHAISWTNAKTKVPFDVETNKQYLMTSFMSLTGCFLDFFADSTGMGIGSGGGKSAVRSSSPKMAACWVKSMSCMNDMLRLRAKSRSWAQSRIKRSNT